MQHTAMNSRMTVQTIQSALPIVLPCMRNRDLVKRIFANGEQLADLDYLVSILSSLIPAVISTWYEHRQNESAETVYAHVAKCTGLIATALNS